MPITVETCGEFDPWSVPTLADLNDQINDFDKSHPGSQTKGEAPAPRLGPR